MIKYFTALAAAITPLMYFHGALFHDAYLRALGVPPELFRIPFEEVLVQGFAAYMLLSIPALLILFLYLLVAFGAVYNMNEATKITYFKQLISWVAQRFKDINIIDRTQGHHLTEKTIKWLNYSLVGVFTMIVVLAATLGLAIKIEKLGKENASNNIKYASKNLVMQKLKLNSGSVIQGYTLECSNYGCAVYTDKIIQIIPLTEVESIDTLISVKTSRSVN